MRPDSRRDASGPRSPEPTYSAGQTLLGTALTVALLAGVVVAASYPVAAVTAVALALVGRSAVRALRHRLRARREQDRTRTVCVPKTGVCVEA